MLWATGADARATRTATRMATGTATATPPGEGSRRARVVDADGSTIDGAPSEFL